MYYLIMHLMFQIQTLMKIERIPSALCGEMKKLSVKTKRDVVQNSSLLLVQDVMCICAARTLHLYY
jgi:hypothetical protein